MNQKCELHSVYHVSHVSTDIFRADALTFGTWCNKSVQRNGFHLEPCLTQMVVSPHQETTNEVRGNSSAHHSTAIPKRTEGLQERYRSYEREASRISDPHFFIAVLRILQLYHSPNPTLHLRIRKLRAFLAAYPVV